MSLSSAACLGRCLLRLLLCKKRHRKRDLFTTCGRDTTHTERPADLCMCAWLRRCPPLPPSLPLSLQSLEHASYVAALCGGSGRTRRRRGGAREEERRFDIGERTHVMSTNFWNLEKLPSSQSIACMVLTSSHYDPCRPAHNERLLCMPYNDKSRAPEIQWVAGTRERNTAQRPK